MSTQRFVPSTSVTFPDVADARSSDGLGEKLLLAPLRRRLLTRARGRILDVACGDGANFAYFPADSTITAGDVSPFQLSTARSRAIATSRNVEIRQFDAEHLPFPDATFDTVVSSLALCSYNDPIKALQEFERVARPDGVILLLEHGRSNLGPVAAWQDWLERRRGKHTGCHANREPLQLARQAGLEIVDAQRNLFGILHAIEARPRTASH
jgi:ubiquinone/menaquinone biosynthesis C-methylase UbiE